MPLPRPFPSLILHYSYLWHDQTRLGLEEGTKDRPCVIVSAAENAEAALIVLVAPITHRAPRDPNHGLEIPAATKRRLGMDDDRSWIVVTEVNRFQWPGLDLRPVPRGVAGQYAYGAIPPALFLRVKAAITQGARNRALLSSQR